MKLYVVEFTVEIMNPFTGEKKKDCLTFTMDEDEFLRLLKVLWRAEG